MSQVPRIIVLLCIFQYSICSSCKRDKTPVALFELTQNSGINFENTVTDGKLENSFLFRNFYNGGGVAIGDLNNDGFADVLLSSNMGNNKLYLNKGNFKFEDITANPGSYKTASGARVSLLLISITTDGWISIFAILAIWVAVIVKINYISTTMI